MCRLSLIVWSMRCIYEHVSSSSQSGFVVGALFSLYTTAWMLGDKHAGLSSRVSTKSNCLAHAVLMHLDRLSLSLARHDSMDAWRQARGIKFPCVD